MMNELKKDFSVCLFSLIRNCQKGVFGERGEQWIATKVILLGFIFADKLPFSWALKLAGVMLLVTGLYLVVASSVALKVINIVIVRLFVTLHYFSPHTHT